MARSQSEAPAESGAFEPDVEATQAQTETVPDEVPEEGVERAVVEPRSERRPDGSIANFDTETASVEAPRELGA